MDNLTNNASYDIPGINEFRHASSSLLTLLSFIGAILNTLIIWYSRKLRRTTGDMTHGFVCSMALADLLLCCFAQPFEFVLEYLNSSNIPDWICRLQHMINWLGYSASGMSLTLLNLDKLIFFKWPLHYGSIDADKTATYAVSASWLLCLFGTIMMIVPGALELSPDGNCDTNSVSAGLYIFYTVAFCMLPVLSSALVSAYLASLVARMRRYSAISVDESGTQQRLRAMAYIFITTGWTFISLFPFRFFNILRLYFMEGWYEDYATYAVISWMAHIFFLMLALNPFVDACLTLTTYAPYKNLAKANLVPVKMHFMAACPRGNIVRQSHSEWV